VGKKNKKHRVGLSVGLLAVVIWSLCFWSPVKMVCLCVNV